MGATLAVAGALTVGATWLRWFVLMNRVTVPRDRSLYVALQGAGAALGIAGLTAGTGVAGGLLGAVAAIGGLMFVAMWAASAQAAVVPAVAVGDRVIDFSAPDENGRPFHLATLDGKRLLLKFFRGHW